MKAVVLEGFGGVENFKDADLPVPEPKAGEMRVKIHFAAFNPVITRCAGECARASFPQCWAWTFPVSWTKSGTG